jgi:hypothetical protein
MEKTNEKKEKKFNSAKIKRQAEKSLKAVFPKARFFVSDGRPVEAITLDQNGYSDLEMQTFRKVFCALSGVDAADIIMTRVKREDAGEKKPAAAVPAK